MRLTGPMTNRALPHLTILAVAATLVLAAGCSVSGEVSLGGGSGGLSQTELEDELLDNVTLDDPEGEAEVACESGLDDEVDAIAECTVSDGQGGTSNIRPTVTDTGSDFAYDVVVYVPAAELEPVLAGQIGPEVTVVCEDELLGEVGESVDCEASDSTGSATVTATVSEVNGLRINFDISTS